LHQVRKTVLEMLRDRGYLVPKEELKMTYEDFCQKFKVSENGELRRDDLTILKQKQDDPSQQIFVFFPEEPKVGIKPIRRYCARMKEEMVQQAIVVVQQSMSPIAKKAISHMAPVLWLECFEETDLLVNITEHILVPKHILLTKEEEKALLERYRLKKSQLPRMQTHDPVARYYGLKDGDIVKIIRPSETAGRYVTYRLVLG